MEKNKTNNKIIIFCLLIIIIGICISYFIYNKNLKEEPNYTDTETKDEDTTTNTNNTNDIDDLDINSEEVKNLYNLIPDYIDYSAYLSSGVSNYLNTTDAVIMKAISNSNITSNRNNTNGIKCEELMENGIYNSCESGEYYEYYKININKKRISDGIKKIIGVDNEKTFNYKSIITTDLICSYKNDEYYCYDTRSKYDDLTVNKDITSIKKIINTTKSNDEIKIYDKYVVFIGEEYYNSYDMEKHLASSDDVVETISDYESNFAEAPTYVHIFKKDSEGNYYWYSTELYKDGTIDESIIKTEYNISDDDYENMFSNDYVQIDTNNKTVQKLFKIFTRNYDEVDYYSGNDVTIDTISLHDVETVAFGSGDIKYTKKSCKKYLSFIQKKYTNNDKELSYYLIQKKKGSHNCCTDSGGNYNGIGTYTYKLEDVKNIIKKYFGEEIANKYPRDDVKYITNSSSHERLYYNIDTQEYFCLDEYADASPYFENTLSSAYTNGNELIMNVSVSKFISDDNQEDKYNYKFTFTYNNSTNSYNFTKLEKTKLN